MAADRAHSAKRTAPKGVSRTERRRAARVRRNRTLVLAAVVGSVALLAVWFPAGALVDQHRKLGAAGAQLAQTEQENQSLAHEAAQLREPAEAARLARQQFELAKPGQQSYEVLPPAGQATGGTYSGDPGLAPPASPSPEDAVPPGVLDPTAATPGASDAAPFAHPAAKSRPPSGLWTRIEKTIEFWR